MQEKEEIYNQIISRLKNIEYDHGVKIIYACESGSRAWGFPSIDSDYDIRFLYLRPLKEYLKVSESSDVIAPKIVDDFDLSGWDTKKAIALLIKSNCALIEWLASPVIYIEEKEVIRPIRTLIDQGFLPCTAFYHYLALAKGKIKSIGKSDAPSVKAYFYALRATLCCRYIADCKLPPAVEFGKLLQKYIPSGEVRDLIDSVIRQKQTQSELNSIGRVELFDEFLNKQLKELVKNIPRNPEKIALECYDHAFLETLTLNYNMVF